STRSTAIGPGPKSAAIKSGWRTATRWVKAPGSVRLEGVWSRITRRLHGTRSGCFRMAPSNASTSPRTPTALRDDQVRIGVPREERAADGPARPRSALRRPPSEAPLQPAGIETSEGFGEQQARTATARRSPRAHARWSRLREYLKCGIYT